MNIKMLRMIVLLVFCILIVGCQSTSPSFIATPEATYMCRRASGQITIDGRLDERDWHRAEVIERFYEYSSGKLDNTVPIRVRMLWGDDTLYVAFECVDDDIWSFSDVPDDKLWNGDVVELFIKPSTARNSYSEFVVAPNGTLFDAMHASRGGGGGGRYKTWSSGALVGSEIHGTDANWQDQDSSYCVEMAIPLKVLEEVQIPMIKRVWTFGVFRYDYSKSYESPVLQMSIQESLKHGFHYYEGYHELRFSE